MAQGLGVQDATGALGSRHHSPWRYHTPRQTLGLGFLGRMCSCSHMDHVQSLLASATCPHTISSSALGTNIPSMTCTPTHSASEGVPVCPVPVPAVPLCALLLQGVPKTTEILHKTRGSQLPCCSEQSVPSGHLKHGLWVWLEQGGAIPSSAAQPGAAEAARVPCPRTRHCPQPAPSRPAGSIRTEQRREEPSHKNKRRNHTPKQK